MEFMIQLGQLNKENLTVKKGMFTKKLTVADEAKFPVTENTNIRLTGFTLEESLVEVYVLQTQKIISSFLN